MVRTLKIIMVGPGGVGKSSLVRRFAEDAFSHNVRATIGVDVTVQRLLLPEGDAELILFDMAGQQTFDDVRMNYCRNAHSVIFVYDVSRPETLRPLAEMYRQISQMCFIPRGEYPRGVLVANKIDIDGDHSEALERGRQLAKLLSLEFVMTSARTGDGVGELFLCTASEAACAARQES